MLKAGLEPARLAAKVFETFVATYFTIRAYQRTYVFLHLRHHRVLYYTKFQKYLISPGYKKPSNPFIRTKGLDKTTTLVLFIFFSQTSVVVSSYKNRPSCCLEERKVESLSYKLILLLIFRTEKGLYQKSAEKVLIILLGLKIFKKAGAKGGT